MLMMRSHLVSIVILGLASVVFGQNSFLQCAIDNIDIVWVLDSTSTMQSVLDLMVGTEGIMDQVARDLLEETSTAATSIFTFEDKPIVPFGHANDQCYGSKILFFASNPVDVSSFDIILGDGGDVKDSQLDGVYEAMQFVSALRTAVYDDLPMEDLGLNPLPQYVPSWNALDSMEHVFVLVTDGRPHTEEDGPPGFPSPPNDSTYLCEQTTYPSLLQIKSLADAVGFKLVVLADTEDVIFYQDFFSLLGNSVVVKSFVEGDKAATLNTLQTAVNTVVCGCDPSLFDLQLVHLQDISFSYANDLPYVKTLVPEVISELAAEFKSLKVGLGIFSDKAVPPFGQKSVDTCYTLLQPFTSDLAAFSGALSNLSTRSGKDWPESQLDAIVRAVEDPSLIWADSTLTAAPGPSYQLSIIMVATDAGYHVEGDYSPISTNFTCIGQDYPSVGTVGSTLSAAGVFPLFLATSDVYPIYSNLIATLGVEAGSVQQLADDSSDIVNSIKEGIFDICVQETRRRRL